MTVLAKGQKVPEREEAEKLEGRAAPPTTPEAAAERSRVFTDSWLRPETLPVCKLWQKPVANVCVWGVPWG